jgi:hypothetical protein
VGFAGANETLNHYVAETRAKTHGVTLSPKTAKHYASLYDLHLEPYLGDLKLTELSPDVVGRWQADRIAAGAGRVAVLQALDLLGSILQRAVEVAGWGAIACGWCGRSLARGARTSSRSRRGRWRRCGRRQASGTRRCSRCWRTRACGRRTRSRCSGGRYADKTLLVERAVSLGLEKDTKTTAHRTVRLLTPLREDLVAWKLRSDRPRDHKLVFPGPTGELWTKTTYDNWRKRAFDRARQAAGADEAGHPVRAAPQLRVAATARGALGDLRGAPDGP